MQVWNVLHVARWKYRTQKLRKKIAIRAPSHNFVGLYLCNWGMYRQSEKKLVKQQYLLHMSAQYGELRPASGSLGHPSYFQRLPRLGSVTARQSSSERQSNFAALNKGRHLCSAGRPSRWALAHISSYIVCQCSPSSDCRRLRLNCDYWHHRLTNNNGRPM